MTCLSSLPAQSERGGSGTETRHHTTDDDNTPRCAAPDLSPESILPHPTQSSRSVSLHLCPLLSLPHLFPTLPRYYLGLSSVLASTGAPQRQHKTGHRSTSVAPESASEQRCSGNRLGTSTQHRMLQRRLRLGLTQCRSLLHAMSQFQPRQNDPPRDACHPPTIQQPAMSEVPSQYPDVTPGFATNATAPRLGLEYIPPSQRSVVLDSPFISEPRADSPADDDEYRSAPTPIPTPAADSAGATPIAERSNVRFPRQVSVQPPERQGTAKPRDYQPRRRAYGEGSSGHDQKLADMGSVSADDKS